MSSLEAAFNSHSAQLASGAQASALVHAFGRPPALAGASVEGLQPIGGPGFAQPPGPLMGAGASQAPPYYLAYDDNTDGRILWFKINVGPDGSETIAESGWRKPAAGSGNHA